MITKQYFEEMPKRNTFRFWFEKIGPNTYSVIDQESDENEFVTVGTFNNVDHEYDLPETVAINDVIADFAQFEQRPEYKVGKEVILDASKTEEMIDEYEERILGCILMKYEQRFDLDNYEKYAWSTFDALVSWLRQSDFYEAPASTQYHDSYHGGLLYHSLKVFNQLLSVRNIDKFKNISYMSSGIVSLVHDWCKIGLYQSYMKNVKNEKTGQWEKQLAYKYNQTGAPLGHGATSMFLASKFFTLSLEEACAIRWHMGEYNIANNEMNELHKANHNMPLVYAIQFADRLACVEY